MAGVFPPVESARRRIRQSSGSPSSAGHGHSRRSSVCRFTGNHETHVISPSSFQRSAASRASIDEMLGDFARVAKARLDDRLGAHRKLEIRRNNSDVDEETLRIVNGRTTTTTTTTRELQTEVFGSKKSVGSKRLSWAKVGWKPWEQEDCAVCLEEFVIGENLVNLPCAHKFHSRCFLPWLQNNSHCPCCRSAIFSQN